MDARSVLEQTIAILLVFGRAINGIFRGDARRAVEFLQLRTIPLSPGWAIIESIRLTWSEQRPLPQGRGLALSASA